MANRALGAPRLTGPQPLPKQAVAAQSKAQADTLIKAGDSRLADRAFFLAMLGCALSVLALVGLIVYELVTKSSLSWHAFGLKFFFRSEWDPVNDQYGALPFVYGTIVSSILALLIAVPLAIGVAVYITEMSPRWLRGALAFTTELLAAIPSVIYGLWAIFVLVPLLRQYVQPFLARYFGWTTCLWPPYGIGMLAAGIILAIMVVPIVSSITAK
jgi:phosphate transport system permease protein